MKSATFKLGYDKASRGLGNLDEEKMVLRKIEKGQTMNGVDCRAGEGEKF